MVAKVPPARERAVTRKHFKELMASPLLAFPKVGIPLDAPRTQGVYVIYDPKRVVAHVGKTIRGKKGLLQRLRNHLQAQSSFVINHLNSRGARLRRGYTFRCLPVESARERALLEFFAIAELCPEHIGLGEVG